MSCVRINKLLFTGDWRWNCCAHVYTNVDSNRSMKFTLREKTKVISTRGWCKRRGPGGAESRQEMISVCDLVTDLLTLRYCSISVSYGIVQERMHTSWVGGICILSSHEALHTCVYIVHTKSIQQTMQSSVFMFVLATFWCNKKIIIIWMPQPSWRLHRSQMTNGTRASISCRITHWLCLEPQHLIMSPDVRVPLNS